MQSLSSSARSDTARLGRLEAGSCALRDHAAFLLEIAQPMIFYYSICTGVSKSCVGLTDRAADFSAAR